MSDAAATLAAPIVLRHKDKDYPLSPLTLDDMSMFERWLENRAFDTITVRKGHIDDDDYNRLLTAWIGQCASGQYRCGSKIGRAACSSEDGMRFLFFLMLAKETPSMTQKISDRIFDEQRAEATAKMEVANAHPLADAGAA